MEENIPGFRKKVCDIAVLEFRIDFGSFFSLKLPEESELLHTTTVSHFIK
ncbi:MAG: hypothetical protein ACI92E_002697 [Oceanicoccus sp.]|jgi:hypothetical protein